MNVFILFSLLCLWDVVHTHSSVHSRLVPSVCKTRMAMATTAIPTFGHPLKILPLHLQKLHGYPIADTATVITDWLKMLVAEEAAIRGKYGCRIDGEGHTN